jgi:hypothetical protein
MKKIMQLLSVVAIVTLVGCSAFQQTAPVQTEVPKYISQTNTDGTVSVAEVKHTVQHPGLVPGPVITAAEAAKPFIPSPYGDVLSLALAGVALYFRQKNVSLAKKYEARTPTGT